MMTFVFALAWGSVLAFLGASGAAWGALLIVYLAGAIAIGAEIFHLWKQSRK